MAKKSTEYTIEEKLTGLYELQRIDSKIDKIRIVRGELPLEVQDLEDEIEGLDTRLTELETSISDRKNMIKEAKAAIKKYSEQQKNVRNNREYDSISKEIEFQELEIQLSDKKILEGKAKVEHKAGVLTSSKEKLEERKKDLELKKNELEEISAETEKDEKKLMKQSDKAKKDIEERLVIAYDRLRDNARNGLAVVTIERSSCGGCFNTIPPQRQLDIRARKKVIVCEHCGRILVDATFDPNYVEPVIEEKPKRRITRKKTTEEAK